MEASLLRVTKTLGFSVLVYNLPPFAGESFRGNLTLVGSAIQPIGGFIEEKLQAVASYVQGLR
jgi:hypothetical protein